MDCLVRTGQEKSTFIKMLSGQLPTQSGEVVKARDLKVGYFAQHQVEQLNPDESPMDHLARIDPDVREGEMRKWLGGFGFSDDTVFMNTGPFSGGEKSRLALALLVYQRPNLLLLDEPTKPPRPGNAPGAGRCPSGIHWGDGDCFS